MLGYCDEASRYRPTLGSILDVTAFLSSAALPKRGRTLVKTTHNQYKAEQDQRYAHHRTDNGEADYRVAVGYTSLRIAASKVVQKAPALIPVPSALQSGTELPLLRCEEVHRRAAAVPLQRVRCLSYPDAQQLQFGEYRLVDVRRHGHHDPSARYLAFQNQPRADGRRKTYRA